MRTRGWMRVAAAPRDKQPGYPATMNLAFALYKYFPYGGLQRDMLGIALACVESGASVTVYCSEWQGEQPDTIRVVILPVQGHSNHVRNRHFAQALQHALRESPVDYVVGFNKMPGLDCYYAADTCFKAKVMQERFPLVRFLPRYRQFLHDEAAVFSTPSTTRILAISDRSVDEYKQYYPGVRRRCLILPPGIALNRKAPRNAAAIRQAFRTEHFLLDDERVVLMIGSGFRTKGLDRAIHALAALPKTVLARTRLMVIGQDNPDAFIRQARALGVQDRITFFAGRDDIPAFLQGADVLIHPAYRENTGTVLLEAAVAGLPVLTTEVCGYSHYIRDNNCGVVITEPFEQERLNQQLATMLENDEQRDTWKAHALAFADTADIYSLHQRAATVIVKAASTRGDETA